MAYLAKIFWIIFSHYQKIKEQKRLNSIDYDSSIEIKENKKRKIFAYLTFSLITMGFVHSLLTTLNTVFDLLDNDKQNSVKNIMLIGNIIRFFIDLLFALSFLGLAYSFGIKRLEFQSNFLNKDGKA